MKILAVSFALCCSISIAHAQLLPVPGAKNPDWKTDNFEALPGAISFGEAPKTDRMPNAVQNSIISEGNLHHYWDANRQLAYQWRSRSGSGTVAPDKEVLVREERTGLTYTYRRRR
ncbi:hypothetical protein [Hymenobacter terricola]|uniref:hypothetical protein n=1 Tax=Hymenobacter terricola TaxID=2819236 RepID=UPI001B305204|nr:hypothetical protein [Hymenobacter terricola]